MTTVRISALLFLSFKIAVKFPGTTISLEKVKETLPSDETFEISTSGGFGPSVA